MLIFADMCHMGYGVAQNDGQAQYWWNRSAQDGSRVAAQRLRTGIQDSQVPCDEAGESADSDLLTPDVLRWVGR